MKKQVEVITEYISDSGEQRVIVTERDNVVTDIMVYADESSHMLISETDEKTVKWVANTLAKLLTEAGK